MKADFPAAHSMDSCWFAVDQDGHVAYFDTGEGGAMPDRDDFPKGMEAANEVTIELVELLIALIEARPELAAVLAEYPDWRERLGYDVETSVALQAWLGLYRYDCIDGYAAPYVRGMPVAAPVSLGDLPERFRERLAAARLAVRFEGAPRIAVPAIEPSQAWSDFWEDLDGELHSFNGADLPEEDFREGLPPAEVDATEPFDDAGAIAFLRELLANNPPNPRLEASPSSEGLWSRFLGWFKR